MAHCAVDHSSGCDWRRVLMFALLAYALAFAARLFGLPDLNDPMLYADGEYLMTTHDAYHWLSMVDFPTIYLPHPFADLLGVIHNATGIPLDRLGFWTPLVFSSFVAVVLVLFGALFGSVEAGLSAGCLASMIPSFLMRTGAGFCDTDIIMLVFPLIMLIVPAWWINGYVLSPLPMFREGHSVERAESFSASPWQYAVLILGGLWGLYTQPWHPFFEYLSIGIPVVAACIVLACAKKSVKAQLLVGILIYALPMGFGVVGLVLAIACSGFLLYSPDKAGEFLSKNKAVYVLLVAIVIAGIKPVIFMKMYTHIQVYLKPLQHEFAATSSASKFIVSFPSVVQSIIEAQNLAISTFLEYIYPIRFIAVAGMIGFLAVVLRYPAAALLLPLWLLSLASLKLGGRMSMFAAPAFGIGLVFPIFWFVEFVKKDLLNKGVVRLLLSVAVTILVLLPPVDFSQKIVPYPILSPNHAKALKAIREKSPEDAYVWTWWDFGYATHYFAHRKTLTDGAKHNAHLLYPQAAVYTTDSPRFANQMIKYVASNENSLFAAWLGKPLKEVQQLLDDMAETDMNLQPPQKQYLVATFDTLRLAGWISRFGNWDFATKTMAGYNLSSFGQVRMNQTLGAIQLPNGRTLGLETFDLLENGKLQHKEYMRFSGLHLIIDNDTGERIGVDSNMYNTMLFRLTLGNPEDPEITNFFKLVYDNGHTRVYEVL